MARNIADLRADIRNATPTCGVYHNTTQTVVSAAVVLFNTEYTDRWGMHDTGANTSRITIVVPGIYVFSCMIQGSSDAAGHTFFAATILKNGTDFLFTSPLAAVPAGIAPFHGVTGQARLNKGDYIEVRLDYTRASGGNTTVAANNGTTEQRTQFWATWITGY